MRSESFKIYELVPPKVYEARGEKAWELIDNRIIETIDQLKKIFHKGTMTINNWYWNGSRQWSGLRTPDSAYYSETSQHSFGRAMDIVFSEYTAAEVRAYILDNIEQFNHIKGLEDFDDMQWVHIDCRNYDGLKVFKG